MMGVEQSGGCLRLRFQVRLEAPSIESQCHADEEEDEEEEAAAGKQGAGEEQGGSSFLSAWVRNIKTSVVGTAALTCEDIAPALKDLKRRLMERNVANDIAERWAVSRGMIISSR